MTLTLNAQGLVDTNALFMRTVDCGNVVGIMEQSRQYYKFIVFFYSLRTVDISYVNEKSLEALSLLHEIQVVFRFLTGTWK